MKKWYLHAAKAVFYKRLIFSCTAVEASPGGLTARNLYELSMSPFPEKRGISVRDIMDAVGDNPPDSPVFDLHTLASRNLRVWLLCTMAAACDDLR